MLHLSPLPWVSFQTRINVSQLLDIRKKIHNLVIIVLFHLIWLWPKNGGDQLLPTINTGSGPLVPIHHDPLFFPAGILLPSARNEEVDNVNTAKIILATGLLCHWQELEDKVKLSVARLPLFGQGPSGLLPHYQENH